MTTDDLIQDLRKYLGKNNLPYDLEFLVLKTLGVALKSSLGSQSVLSVVDEPTQPVTVSLGQAAPSDS